MELKVSVVVTVKDDKAGITRLMEALEKQTVRPDEVIIVESGRQTNNFIKDSPWLTPRRILSVDCSRGKGRNIGVRAARNEVVAVTDAGCRPRPDWLEKMIAKISENRERGPYKGPTLPRQGRTLGTIGIVAAGGYRVAAKTELQEIMAHFLVPRLGGESPLPASRSIMFTKKAWEAVGGYPEEAVSGAEDLEFSRRLAIHPDVKMIYCPEAVVDWEPPASLKEFFRDIVKHTRGNVEIMYWPHLWRNLTVMGRWGAFVIWPWLGAGYLVWILGKLGKLGKFGKFGRVKMALWLPVAQVAADGGVIAGLIIGLMAKIANVDHIKVRPCRGKVGPWEPKDGL